MEAEEGDGESILEFYRTALKLRAKSQTLLAGSYLEYEPGDEQIYTYERALGNNRYLILCSLSGSEAIARIPEPYRGRKARLMLSNYRGMEEFDHLDPARYDREILPTQIPFGPYEARVYQVKLG